MASPKCTASAKPPYRRCVRRSAMRSAAPWVITFSTCQSRRKKSCARWECRGADRQSEHGRPVGAQHAAPSEIGKGSAVTMPNIKLLQPTTLDEALSLLSAHGDETKIISGGTALVIM